MRRSKAFPLILIIVLLSGSLRIPRSAIAASSIRPPDQHVVADYIPPAMTTLAVMGDYAYVGAGPSLLVIDVSDPDHPQRVAYRLLPANATQVVTAARRVYVLTNDDPDSYEDNHVLIFNAGEPQSPRLIGDYAGNVYCIAAEGMRLYLGNNESLKILDVSDPRHPALLSEKPIRYPLETRITEIALIGNNALIAISGIGVIGAPELWIVDISDPGQPIEIGKLKDIYDYELPSYITDLSVDGSLVALAGHTVNDVSKFVLVNISDPAQPAILCSEVFAYSGDSPSVALLGHRVYVAIQDYPIAVFDISDPSTPVEIETEEDPVWALETSGDLILNAAGALGLAIYESQGTGGLLRRGALLGTGAAQDVVIQDGTLYIADGGVNHYFYDYYNGGLAIASPPSSGKTEIIGKFTQGGHGSSVVVRGSQAYLIAGYCFLRYTNCWQDFYTLDVLNPETVSISGDFAFEDPNPNSENPPGPLSVQNQIAYIPNLPSQGGLAVFDVSQPTTPTLLSIYKPPLPPSENDAYSNIAGAAISGTYGLVSVSMDVDYVETNSVQVLDISNPYSLTVLMNYPLNWPTHVFIQGSLGFVADRDDQGDSKVLKLLGLSQLPKVQFLADITTPGIINDVIYDGRYAYVADGQAGLLVYDLQDPLNPVEVYAYNTPGNARALAKDDDWIYLADDTGGLLILRNVTPRAYLPLMR